MVSCSAQITLRCSGVAANLCTFERCKACCLALGGGRLDFNACASHHVSHNPAPYFIPNNILPRTVVFDVDALPILSPADGDITRPVGLAVRDFIGHGWQWGQQLLKTQAEHRLLAEGFTINVFLWSTVSALWTHTPPLSRSHLPVSQDSQEPACYRRVVRRHQRWSLWGDSNLWNQLVEIPPQNQLCYWNASTRSWWKSTIYRLFDVEHCGLTLYLKYADVVHTPFMPQLLQRMYKPGNPIPNNEKITSYFAHVV